MIAAWTAARSPFASITRQRAGSAAAMAAKPAATRAWKGGVHAFVAVGVTRAGPHAGGADFGRDVEHQREIGAAGEQGGKLGDEGAVGALAVALVGHGAVGEAVGDDVHAGGEGGEDRAVEVLGAGGEVKVRFGTGGPAVGAGEEHGAEGFGAGCAARFAGEQDGVAGGGERVGQEAGLRALAGALPALQGDEAAGQPPVT